MSNTTENASHDEMFLKIFWKIQGRVSDAATRQEGLRLGDIDGARILRGAGLMMERNVSIDAVIERYFNGFEAYSSFSTTYQVSSRARMAVGMPRAYSAAPTTIILIMSESSLKALF
jgi:hypothetical protein